MAAESGGPGEASPTPSPSNGRCDETPVSTVGASSDVASVASDTQKSLAPIVEEASTDVENGPRAFSVSVTSENDVSFETRRDGSGQLQILALSTEPGRIETAFEHVPSCSASLKLRTEGDGAELLITVEDGLTLSVQIGRPWAMDSEGKELPTWYEVEGTELTQVVDASGASAPILFDPTYSSMSCSNGHYSSLTAWEYLDMYAPSTDYGFCSVSGMFYAANGYYPVWGFETNVANDYGWIPLRQSGGCSFSPDTGWAWDFQVPCKAHDYCYDLRKASFSGTVSDYECDTAFYFLMDAHCNNRVFQGDCNIVRDSYYLAVRVPSVVTNPNPGNVTIVNRGSFKCADVEGPSTAENTPIQQWSCVNVNQQRWRIWPASGYPGYFEIRSVFSGKCVGATGYYNVVVQQACGSGIDYHRFRIQGALGLDQYSIRDGQSSYQNCWKSPQTSANGANLQNPTCNDYSNWYIWRIYGA